MTQDQGTAFELPGKLEKILASLAKYCEQNGKPILQGLLVNSTYRVHEEWSYDNWNGGTYGHAIYFHVPAALYYEIFDNLNSVAQEICEGINRLSNVQNEHIDEVCFELQDDVALDNWRENSGVLVHTSPATAVAPEDQLTKIWDPERFRLFLSHKAEYKLQASKFRIAMDDYGVSCFVAHEDIEPTKEWQNEIEKALFSMDAMVALMTELFSSSDWTDQEIGVAIGRRVFVIPIRLGMDPYGFIGKYQALSGAKKNPETLAREVYELLWTKPNLTTRLVESLISRFESSKDFHQANHLMDFLEKIDNTSPQLIDRLENAPKNNGQVAGAYEVQGRLAGLIKKLRGGI